MSCGRGCQKGGAVRSSERAQSLGEVFTQPRDVNAILDLIADQNYASRYLEPGCGSGNFLAEILSRKLALVDKMAKPSHQAGPESVAEWEFLALSALAAVYGIEGSKLDNKIKQKLKTVVAKRKAMLTGQPLCRYVAEERCRSWTWN